MAAPLAWASSPQRTAQNAPGQGVIQGLPDLGPALGPVWELRVGSTVGANGERDGRRTRVCRNGWQSGEKVEVCYWGPELRRGVRFGVQCVLNGEGRCRGWRDPSMYNRRVDVREVLRYAN